MWDNIYFIMCFVMLWVLALVGWQLVRALERVRMFETTKLTVSPWDYQLGLMLASKQQVAEYPQMNSGLLLYLALCMEELGETLIAASKAIRDDGAVLKDLTLIQYQFLVQGSALQESSKKIRKALETLGPFVGKSLTLEQAGEILDGLTDLHVVCCGASISGGLPGEAAYRIVGDSNLSKRNPMTGIIDKTPDGKWIKGSQYQPPDFTHILRRAFRNDFTNAL